MSSLLSRINFKRTLQVNILLAFASLLVATVLIIVSYTYRQNSQTVLTLADDLIDQVNNNVIERTTNYLSPATQIARSSARLPNIDTQSLADSPGLITYGTDIVAQYPQFSGFLIGNENGDFLFTKRDSADNSIDVQIIDRTLETPLRTWTYNDRNGRIESIEETTDFTYDPRQRPWYIGTAEKSDTFWTDIYIFFTEQKPGITASHPVYDGEGNLTAVIGLDVALEDLSSFLETQKVGENGVAFILNQTGELVAFPNVSLAIEDGDSLRPVHISELDDMPWVTTAYDRFTVTNLDKFVFTIDGVEYIASFRPFDAGADTIWQIGLVVPSDDFLGAINQTNQVTLYISLMVLAVAIFFVILISRSISQPIVTLTHETDRIKSFDLDGEHSVSSQIREVQALSESITSMRTSLRAFKKYVPAELVRQLVSTGEDAKLGGAKKELTILFADIVGFTTITESVAAEALMAQLSDFLGRMASIVMDSHGTVDKFMGDGIMAFWGAPLGREDHAEQACRAALAMIAAVDQFNAEWTAYGGVPFALRVGVHTGETLVGNMGSDERMNYTLVGDSVNLTSRLEGANKVYGTKIIISQSTVEKVNDRFHTRPLDTVTVKGKRKFVKLFELLGEHGKTTTEQITLAEQFTAGFNAYVGKDWSAAQKIFEDALKQYPEDTPTQIYRVRSIALQLDPPGDDWEPITHLESYTAEIEV